MTTPTTPFPEILFVRRVPKDYQPTTAGSFSQLFGVYRGYGTFFLSAPGKPAIAVQHRPTPTMCGGGMILITGRSDVSEDRLRRTQDPGFPGLTYPERNFFAYNRRGILVLQATLSADEAEAWLPWITASVRQMEKYYARKGEVLASPMASWSQPKALPAPTYSYGRRMTLSTSPGRTHSYLWMLQHANPAKQEQYTHVSHIRCPRCKELVAGPICRPCGEWLTGGHQAYTDDEGLVIDKATSYGRNHRFHQWIDKDVLATCSVATQINCVQGSPVLFLTSWFEGVRRGSLPIPGRPTGPILKILQDLLKRRYIPILTSNVGHVGGAHTPLVMAGLYMNQDLLAEHGMKLCTADTFGTNPKEHYHWIDSMAVVPTSWKELHRASR